MNSVFIYCLALIGIATEFTSCAQKQAQEVAPENGCLIATQTIKKLVSTRQFSQLEPETIVIDRESFQVSTTQKSVYAYDEQGRISIEYTIYPDKADSAYYHYDSKNVTIKRINLTALSKPVSIEKIPLNSQGYAEVQFGTRKATYDKNGYLTCLESVGGTNINYKVQNGNLIETSFSDSPATPTHIIRNKFDYTRPGIPTLPTFYGKESRYLLVQTTIDNQFGASIIPNVYTGNFTHKLDRKGNVLRRVYHGKDGESAYIYGGLIVIVNDYTYTCSK
ncbi:hypothetical protein GCM10028807_55760 [Spirosoma daeguense]